MSVTAVKHSPLPPGRTPQPGALVTVQLCVPGLAADKASIVGVGDWYVGPDGLATMQLDPNSELTPAGTWYTVTDPDGTTWPIVVPVSGAPVQLADCVTAVGPVPALVGVTPSQLAQAVSDLQAQFAAQLGTKAPLADAPLTGTPTVNGDPIAGLSDAQGAALVLSLIGL